jgi:hypothetical protein
MLLDELNPLKLLSEKSGQTHLMCKSKKSVDQQSEPLDDPQKWIDAYRPCLLEVHNSGTSTLISIF